MLHNNNRVCFISCVILLIARLTTEACSDFCHIEDRCVLGCPSENATDVTSKDVWCDRPCQRDHCIAGCRQWMNALNSSCYAACNSTDGHTRSHCLTGCNSAIYSYVEEMKARLGRIAAPIPILGSITNTSVTLEWKWNSTAMQQGWLHLNHAINVSLKSCSHSQPEMCSTWEAVPNATAHTGQWLVAVNELRPYTIYRFRLVIVLASDREPLTSEQSAAIQTLPSGLPSSPPTHLQGVALDANRISISWDPPLYPNGPLVSYSLTIQEASSNRNVESYQDHSALGPRSYIFVHLKPNTTYVVSVAACNSVAEGVGPAATRQLTTFPVEKFVNADLKPYFLMVVDGKFIYRYEPGLIEYNTSPIYESTTSSISALAVHARYGTLYMADDKGFVYELRLKPQSDELNRWSVDKDIVHVRGLSVDWLFDRLYLLLENAEGTSWFISRCKLDGREPTHVVTDIVSKPSHFEVDPFNGFIVWSVNDTDATGGLYTVDLADFANQSVSAQVDSRVKQIVKNEPISTFKADPINSRIFYVEKNINSNATVASVSYSGLSRKILRETMHRDASYISFLDDTFYWIAHGHSFYEEIDQNRRAHTNIIQAKSNSSFTALILCDIRNQPIPIPLSGVRNLEALFGSDSVYIRWEPPLIVADRGRGAWQSWTYHIQLSDMKRGTSVYNDTNSTEIELKGLRPNTTYSIMVQPTTDFDPRFVSLRSTSDPAHIVSTNAYFVGKTLVNGEEPKAIYWATDDGSIYQSSSVGKDVRAFASLNSSLSVSRENARPLNNRKETVVVINMAWMYDSMYVVTNTSRMYHIDLLSRIMTLMDGIEAISVATDWLARKIYWSSAKRQTIGRSLADGSELEWLPIIGIATSMAIHSTKGKLVWCTGHSVEGSFLNADEMQSYWSSGLHSGNQALGTTIDYENDHVYWLVKKLNGASLLYRNHIDSPHSAPVINTIASSAKGPLQYMSSRLIWLQDVADKMVISDLNGNNTYQLNSPKQQRVSWFLPTLFPIRRETLTNTRVIPDAVQVSSVKLNSRKDDENLIISWSPVTNVNYGQVSYDIRVTYRDDNCTAVTPNARFTVPTNWKLQPYTEISVSIRAFTVWGSANVSNAILRLPPSIPEAPLHPRAYVTFVRNKSNIPIEALIHFRWSPPKKPNGELTGYRINCWHETSGARHSDCQDVDVAAGVTEFTARHLIINQNYVFTVKASTQVGYGPETKPFAISTSVETAIPHLVIFTANLLWLADLDKHSSLNQSLAKKTIPMPSPPVTVAFINRDDKVYWIDTLGDFYSHNLLSDGIKKIHHLNGTDPSLTIDWISRHAYWSQREMGISFIYQFDLNKESDEDVTPRLVMRDSRMVRLVEVNPFTSQLIWVSDNQNGSGMLMTTDITNGLTRPFLNNTVSTPPLALQTVTTVDWSDINQPRLLWTTHNDIWSSDFKGYNAAPELSSAEIERTGRWPISSLAVDRTHFYWTDAKERRVHKIRRFQNIVDHTDSSSLLGPVSAQIHRSEVLVELANVYKVVSFGTNFQPLPNLKCLIPSVYPYKVEFVNSTHDSLTLSMPVPQRPQECNELTMATPRYHIYYGPVVSNKTEDCLHNFAFCQNKTFSDNIAVLRKLLPFTQYAVYVSITNHYWPAENSLPSGNATLLSTQAGAPSKPRDVVAIPLSPNSVRVQWLQPKDLNGIDVTYSVYWLPDNKLMPVQEDALQVTDNQMGSPRYSADIPSLAPNTNYTFAVRAHSINYQTNQSDFVQTKTFTNPNPLVIRNIASTSISLEWQSSSTINISRHTLEWTESMRREWKEVDDPVETVANYLYNFTVENLFTLTSYSFRLKLECADTFFYWPDDEEGLTIKTKGNVPDQPLTPRVHERQDLLELWWGPWGSTSTNSHAVLRYVLEMRDVEEGDLIRNSNETEGAVITKSSTTITQSAWKPIYNGTDSFYIAHNLTSGSKYQFRVQAFNDVGASEFSEPSLLYQFKGNSVSSDNTLTVIVSALIVFCSVMTVFLVYVCKRIQFQGKKAVGSAHHISGSEMTDLATLRELPRRESFVQQNNAIYGVGDGDVDQELALLPHIRFEDLQITKFLGRGAFGEVFEGTTCNLPGSNQYRTKVAVKTLRKGATDQEKGEFLKEAILMSQFKHKHILRLLAVCLDANPNFILLELMEGGDLLSFLRNNRPSLREPPPNSATCCQLGLLDLVSMCVDVAKGCCYLEELHFVHRDLAARNCLVSSRDPRFRVVKIGDFGLARDIYRNDYYRKEGEGLLPVRWMAPESLVDGVFTSQTDVWSFGVLLWEILTLGQQPYPARTNLQVLHFVRTGGRLDRPPNCPDSLFELMMSCWSYESSNRPTFTKCLAELLNLQDKLQHSPFTAVHNGHYVGAPLYHGCNNKILLFQDENHNANDSEPWEINRDSVESSGSCSYLDQLSLEQGPVLYTNDIAAMLNGLVNPNSRQTNPSASDRMIQRSERFSSTREPSSRRNNRVATSLVRSNSTVEGSVDCASHGRYLQLLSDYVIGQGCNNGYEVPRTVRRGSEQVFPIANGSSHSSNSQVDNDDISNLTDESCLANDSLYASNSSRTNTIQSTVSDSTMPSDL